MVDVPARDLATVFRVYPRLYLVQRSLACSFGFCVHPAIQFVGKLLCFEVRNVVFVGPDESILVIVNNHLPQARIRHPVGRIIWHSFYLSVEHRATYDTTFQRLYKRVGWAGSVQF